MEKINNMKDILKKETENQEKNKKQKRTSNLFIYILIFFIIIFSLLIIFILKNKDKTLNFLNKNRKITIEENKEIEKNNKRELENEKIKLEKKKREDEFKKTPKKEELLYSENFESYFVYNELILKGNKDFRIEDFKNEIKKYGANIIFEDNIDEIYKIKFNRILNEKLLMDYVAIFKKYKGCEDVVLNLYKKDEF